MKKKAKKVLSLVLALSMVLSMLCFNAGAATIDPGTRNFGAKASRVYTSPDGFTIYYNAGDSLSQNEGYTLQGALDAIENMSSDNVYGIVIASGTHTISDNYDDHVDNGIWVKSGVNLTVSDCQDNDLFFVEEGAHLTISHKAIVQGNGGKLTVSSGTVHATGTFSEVHGTVKTYEDDDTLTINGGNATVDSTDTYRHGDYSDNVAGYENTITINGGTVTVSGSRNNYYYYSDSTHYNSPTDTLVIKGGTVKAGNNNFTAVELNGGSYNFDIYGSQPTINGGANGTGTLIIGACDATIQGSFAKIDGTTGALYLAGNTAIGATTNGEAEKTMNVYSNSSYALTLGSEDYPIDVNDHRAVTVNLVSEKEGTGNGSNCTYTSVGTVTVYANAQVNVIGNTDNRDSDDPYTVGKFVGMGGSVSVSSATHQHNYYNCSGASCSHTPGWHYHDESFDVTLPTFEGEFANIDLNGRKDDVSGSTTPATIVLSGNTVINGLDAADEGITIDGTKSDPDTENYDLTVNTTTAVNVKNVNNLTVGNDEKAAAKVTVVGAVKNANVKENATLTMENNSAEGTTYITGTVTGENGTFTNNDPDAVTTTGTFKAASGGNQGDGPENDLTLNAGNTGETVSGIYGTLTINGATGVTLNGTVDKLIVESGSSITLGTSAWVKETIVINGGAVTMNIGSKIENLDITENRNAVTLNGGSFTMNAGAEINLARHSGHDVALRAIENLKGKVDLLGGTITITGGTKTVAVCNHNDMVIGVTDTALANQPHITLDYGIAVKNDNANAETYIYGIDVNITNESASNIGIDAPTGLMLILAGKENPDLHATPTQTVDVTVNNGTAVKIGDAATWSIAGPYKSARFTANSSVTAGQGVALYTASSTTPADPTVVLVSAVGAALETPAEGSTKSVNFVANQPLSCGVFSGAMVYENAAEKTFYDLIPAKNFDIVDKSNHTNEGWTGTTYYETNKTVIVDVEWALRHAATLGSNETPMTFKMYDVDADSGYGDTIYLDEYTFWGAVEDDDLDVSGRLTLDLNGKTLTKGENFATDTQLIDVTGRLTVNDSYDSDDTTAGVQTIGKIDASALTDAILVKTGNLTVNSGTIIGGTNGINNVYDNKGTQPTTDDTHGTIALISGGTIYGATTGINNAGTIISITGGTIGSDGTNTSATGIANASTGIITTISGGTISGTTDGINNVGTIGASNDTTKGITGGTISGATALNYADGHIYNIIGGTFTGTTTGMYVDNDADGWNFLRVGSTNTGAVFTGITVENGSNHKRLADLFERTPSNDDVLTVKDNAGIELGGTTLRYSISVADGNAVTAYECITGTITAATGTLTKNFTVIPRTHFEVNFAPGPQIGIADLDTENIIDRYDSDNKVLFVKKGENATAKLTAVDTADKDYLIKCIGATDEAGAFSFADNYIPEAMNQEFYDLTFTSVVCDKKVTGAVGQKRIFTYAEESGYTDGTAQYQFRRTNTSFYMPAVDLAQNGTVAVANGNTVKFTFTPATGHAIHSFSGTLDDNTYDVVNAARTYTKEAAANETLTLAYCATSTTMLNNIRIVKGSTANVTSAVNGDACYGDGTWSLESVNPEGAVTLTSGTTLNGVANGTATLKFTGIINNVAGQTATCTVEVYTPSSGGFVGGGGAVAPATYTITCETGVKADVKSSAEGKTITLTVSDGYENVVVKDAKGNEIKVTNNTFKMPASDVTVSVSKKGVATTYDKCDKGEACVLKAFNDLDAWRWYHDGIHYCLDNGVMNGLGNGEFASTASTTRGMIFTILARLDGVTITSTGNEWYTDGQAWSVKAGVSDGTDPTGNITREQLAAMLYRYAKLKGYDVSVGEDTNILSYDDAFSVSEYAVGAMQWAVGAGIINGDNNNLKPTTGATRAEVATMLMRFCETVVK